MTQAAIANTDHATPAAAPSGPLSRPMALNTFQRLMRRWTQLGPYNAGQVMQITGRPDIERWRIAAEGAFAEMGLGYPMIDEQEVARFRPADFVPITQVTGSFQQHVNEELNRPFRDEELPIRFFVHQLADGSHYFGAIYNHWIADSRAMRELMQRIFVRYQSPETPSPLPALTVEQPGNYGQLFGKYVLHLPRTAALWESLRNLRRHLRSFRIVMRDPLDFDSRTIFRQLPEGLIERVHKYAKVRQASVNDLFLAVLGQTMGDYTAPERAQKEARKKRFHLSRNRVGLGTIVDIRDSSAKPLTNVFGLYLSSYTVALKEPENMPFESLLANVAAETHWIKRANLAVRGYCALSYARYWWDKIPRPRTRARIFLKNVPMVAGISNVNMTGHWVDQREIPADGTPTILDYLRISPAGPLLPLVFTLTTIHKRLSLFVTYRTTAFTPEQAEKIVDEFIRRLAEIQP